MRAYPTVQYNPAVAADDRLNRIVVLGFEG